MLQRKKIATHANYLGHIANSITLNLPISRDLITPKKKKRKTIQKSRAIQISRDVTLQK